MRILDKYIVKNIVSSYIFILLAFVGLYLIIDIFSNLSDVLRTKPPLPILLQYYLFSLPLIVKTVSPIAILIATLYVFGELNKNNEIISIRVSGLSIFRVAFPAIFFAVLVSASVFFMQEKILIGSQKKVEDIKSRFIKKGEITLPEEKNLAFISGNMIVFAQKLLPKQKLLKNVILFEENEKRELAKKVIAKDITYDLGFWVGHEIIEYDLDSSGNIIGMPMSFQIKRIAIKESPKELILKKSIFSQYASLTTLKKEISRLRKVKAKTLLSNLTIDYHQKITEPFSHLFLVIGILPLALEIKKRKVGLSSLGLGFIFGFIYFTLSSFSIAFGKSGLILPLISVWITPLFFLTIGITGLLLIK